MCPNWCSCDLYIEGSKKEVDRFLKFAKGKNGILDANNFIPYPKKYKEQDKIAREQDEKRDSEIEKINKKNISNKQKEALIEEVWKMYPHIKDGYNRGGYEWCIKNWGSKWNFSNIEVLDIEKHKGSVKLSITFDSAWSPLDEVIIAMGKKFKELDFELRYFECGCEFNGMLKIEYGKVIEEANGKYFGDRGG